MRLRQIRVERECARSLGVCGERDLSIGGVRNVAYESARRSPSAAQPAAKPGSSATARSVIERPQKVLLGAALHDRLALEIQRVGLAVPRLMARSVPSR